MLEFFIELYDSDLDVAHFSIFSLPLCPIKMLSVVCIEAAI